MKKIAVCLLTIFCMILLCSCGQEKQAAQGGLELPVLMYHNICIEEDEVDSQTVTEKRFSDDLELLSANSYITILPEEIRDIDLQSGQKYVMITFDDGYRSNYELAFPVLKQHKMKAEISVITSLIDEAESHDDFMNWDMLREMDKSGLVEIGSHTDNLHNPDNGGELQKGKNGVQKKFLEGKSKYQKRVLDDIQLSFDKLSNELGHAPHSFAYPYGATDKAADGFIGNLFAVSFSTKPETAVIADNIDTLIIPRYRISQDTDLAEILSLETKKTNYEKYEYTEITSENGSITRQYSFGLNTKVFIVRSIKTNNCILAQLNDDAIISWFENGKWQSENVSEKEYSADWLFIDDSDDHYALYLPKTYKQLENNGLEYLNSVPISVERNNGKLTMGFSSACSSNQITDFCFVQSANSLIDSDSKAALECLYFDGNARFTYDGYYVLSDEDLTPHGDNVFVNCPSCEILEGMLDNAEKQPVLEYLSTAFAHTMIKQACPSGFIPSYAYSKSLNEKYKINEFDNKYYDSRDNSVFVSNLSELYKKYGGSEFRYYLLRYDAFCKKIANENGILENFWAWNINRSTESTPEYQPYIEAAYYDLYDALGRSH